MNSNACTVKVYSTGTTEIADYPRFLSRASGLRFATGYPGGLYLDASFYIARELADWWALQGAQRVVVYNGVGLVVYEGYINSFDYIAADAAQGVQVNCVGAWSKIAMNRRIRKLWADTRIDENTWAWDENQSLELWQVDRSNRIRIMAKGGCTYTTASADDAALVYTAPAGQTIKRVTFNWYFNEYAGRAFTQLTEEYTGSWASLHTVSAAGNGYQDLACSASCTKIRLSMYSNSDNADVESDEKNFASWSKLCIYSTTADIDLPGVVTDVKGLIGEINSTTYYINAMSSPRVIVGSATADPSSFGAFDSETIADILTRAASYGDANNARWATGFKHSELAPSQDGKPVIYCEAYPLLTDFDFSVRLDEPNLMTPLTIKQNFGGIYNYIIVRYTDDSGKQVHVTPEDDASLKDATSITAYGQRDYLLDVGNASSTLAKNNGYRFLAAYKDPQFELPSPVQVRGAIRTKSGLYGPVSQVRAGFRLRIENFLADLTGTGTGATFLISSTDYDDETETVTISAGPPGGIIYPVYQRWTLPDNEWVGTYNGEREAIPAPPVTIPERWTPDMGTPGGGGGGEPESGGGGNKKREEAGLNKKGKPWKGIG